MYSLLPEGYTILTDQFFGTHDSPPGAVTAAEARQLASLILENGCKDCLEIGVANGVSALAITQAAASLGGQVDGIDPWQLTKHNGSALALLEKHQLKGRFSLHPEPTHLAAPKLLGDGRSFDFAFVDGMHNLSSKVSMHSTATNSSGLEDYSFFTTWFFNRQKKSGGI